MANPNATKEAAALGVSALGGWISVHTADPGTTGASEATGGGYARKQTTWTGGASDGTVTGSDVTIDLAAASYTDAGVWTASSGGTFIGPLAMTDITLSATGQLVISPVWTAA